MKRNKNFDREKSPSILDPFRIFIENKKERKGKERRRKMRKQVEKKTRLEIYIFFISFYIEHALETYRFETRNDYFHFISKHSRFTSDTTCTCIFSSLFVFLVFLISRNLRGSINKTR